DRAPLLGGGAVRSRLAPGAGGVRAAVYRGAGRLAAEDWPEPSIGAGEVLLRLNGCGLCGSDIAKIVDPATKVPAVFGHEVVGEVLERLYHRELTITATYSSCPADLA